MSDTPQTETQTPEPAPAPAPGPNDAYQPHIPAAVRRAARRAEELAAAQAAQAQAASELDEVVPPAMVGDNTAPVPSREPQQPQQPQPPAQPDARDARGDARGDDWQHRYNTLQGKYNAETTGLRQEAQQLRTQVQNLEQLISSMQAAPAPVQPAPVELEEVIPEEDYTTYGNDFVDSTRRWARAELAPVVKNLAAQVEELRRHQQQGAGERTRDRVRDALDRDPDLAGRWEALDHDASFHTWLGEFDPFSGARRLDMLREAYASGDAARTGRFFKAYLHEHTDYRQEPQRSQPQTPAPNGGYTNGNGAGRVDLAAFAAPGRAPGATPGPGAPAARIWSNSDIQAFYDGRLRGRYRGREAEADRLERDILAAAAEGRIRNA